MTLSEASCLKLLSFVGLFNFRIVVSLSPSKGLLCARACLEHSACMEAETRSSSYRRGRRGARQLACFSIPSKVFVYLGFSSIEVRWSTKVQEAQWVT